MHDGGILMMDIWYAVIFFVTGTIIGSFLNVVGYRLPKGMSISKPSSHCPSCKHKLKAVELVPILSYIIQLGKCKKCKQRISLFYLLFELVTGLLFLVSYLTWGFSAELFISLIFGSILLVIIISDIIYMIISDEVLIFGGILLFLLRLYMGYYFLDIIINAVVPFVVLFLIKLLGDFFFKKESLGGGDIKLMLIFGLAIGWQLSLLSVFLASFIALPIALIILAVKKTNIIPFGPFLSIAALILYFSRMDISWLLGFILIN